MTLSPRVLRAFASPQPVVRLKPDTTTWRRTPCRFQRTACGEVSRAERSGHGAVYLAAIGGLAALLSKHITAAAVVAYDDLGPEALYALELEHFPAVVIIDREGRNFHEESPARWRRP